MAATEGGGINIDPMHQFQISPFFGGELTSLSFTNSSFAMVLVVLAASAVFLIGSQGRALVPTRLQSVTEVVYDLIRKMVRDIAGDEGLKYFPIIFSIFIFVLFANVIGLIPFPGSFTVTSHLAVTGTMALVIFVTITAIGFIKHGIGFLKFFVPHGAPVAILPLLVPIELISYFVRPISHSVRLAANMLAGHAVLKVFAGFVAPLALAGILPLLTMVALFGLETLVAVVQAYIFTILTCIYLNDALHMH